MDPSHRRSLERFTRPVSVFYNLLAPPQRMEPARDLASMLGSAASQARSSGRTQPRRSHCGCDVFARKKRGACVGKTKRGKGTKIAVLTDGNGLPLTAMITSASPHEVGLIEPLLEKRLLRRRIQRLLYDQAADSDPLRKRLASRGIELICPHRYNRIKPALQDKRSLRRYRRRYRVERSISWLQNFRRLVTRYEHAAHRFLGFVQFACLLIVIKRF